MFSSTRRKLLEPVVQNLRIYCMNLEVAINVVSSYDHWYCSLKYGLFSFVLMFKVILKKPSFLGRLFL